MTKPTVKELNEAVWAAKRAYWEAIACAYPIGSYIEYEHGNQVREVRVLGHSWDRLKVVGVSGTEYWIDASRLENES